MLRDRTPSSLNLGHTVTQSLWNRRQSKKLPIQAAHYNLFVGATASAAKLLKEAAWPALLGAGSQGITFCYRHCHKPPKL